MRQRSMQGGLRLLNRILVGSEYCSFFSLKLKGSPNILQHQSSASLIFLLPGT